MATYETLKQKADRLLRAAEDGTKTPAESRRLLRKCRRYRLKAQRAKAGKGD